mmetsp:Transcript_10956/g.16567  ORF Transcript_10956/g.16567 Transcript_10956/m.16567 type:complete len:541 (+) Transcript_10956:131-1753(+)
MVVLSASILTQNGTKPIVSRQFVEMPRMRVEGLLAAFPKLISSHTRQHTFVETDTVRYIYQPLENGMFLLLITTKTSNIVEDLGTLRLLAKVVPDVAGGLSETMLNEKMFELIFAFDEVLTAGGYKEDISLSDIRTNLEMDSHEEKMAIMMEEAKKMEAKKAMEEKAEQIKKRQMENLKNNLMGNGPTAPAGGMVGIGGGGVTPGYEHNSSAAGSGMTAFSTPSFEKPTEPVEEPVRFVPKKGLTLGGIGGGKKKNDFLSAMGKEENLNLFGTTSKNSKQTDILGFSAAAPAPAAPTSPLTIALEEKYTVSMNREGSIDSCDLKGKLTLTANTEAGATPSITVNKAIMLAKCTMNWNFATHPKVDKKMYEKSGTIVLKGGKPLKLSSPVGVLKWSYSGEDAAPLTINCWPDDEGTGTINVNLEFQLNRPDMTLTDVNILVPLGTTDPPVIDEIDGQYKHDPNTGMLCWHHDLIDSSNSSGSLEFSIGGDDADAFFPVQVMFKSQSFLCPIEITDVTSTATGAPIPNNTEKSVGLDTYAIP